MIAFKRNRTTAGLAIAGLLLACAAPPALAQQDLIDQLAKSDDKRSTLYMAVGRAMWDRLAKASGHILETCMVRVRLTKLEPDTDPVLVQFRTGGEGLGGPVYRGSFLGVDKVAPPWKGGFQISDIDALSLKANEWSAPISLQSFVCGQPLGDLRFVTVFGQSMIKQGTRVALGTPKATRYEFEFSTEDGKVVKDIVEDSAGGSTVTLALSGLPIMVGLVRQGYLKNAGAVSPNYTPELYPDFMDGVRGLSQYVHERYARLLTKFSPNDPLPKKIGILGHLGGYGTKHTNPAIIEEESKVLRLLGMNSIEPGGGAYDTTATVVSLKEFPRLTKGYGTGIDPRLITSSGSPFSAEVRKAMLDAAAATVQDRKNNPAQEYWSICADEIGVALKSGIDTIPDCITEYRKYVTGLGVKPQDLGAATIDDIKPYALWLKDAKGAESLAPAPDLATGRLNYYYTYRFMTYITAELYTDGAQKLEEGGVKLYAMMSPTPSWGGASLDWNEFYDLKANRLLMFETSNRDPRVWEWESYLGDIMRGIGERHGYPLGAMIKPHRGAPKQRMLTLLARGMTGFEWYTYGPDYAKGDGWSSVPYLMDAVGEANRFAAKAEDYVFQAKWPRHPDVAFVMPRSSQIWMGAGKYETSMEDARWVYTALQHDHIPVDVLSEQQLIEGKLDGYKIVYIVGSNLHHSALDKVEEWVRKGGVLWTDFGGLRFDEAFEPSAKSNELLGLTGRSNERWGYVPDYGSTKLPDIVASKPVPEYAVLKFQGEAGDGITVTAGREMLEAKETKNNQVTAQFSDGKTAIVRHQYGLGATYTVGAYAGNTYSAKIRRADYDMAKDFDPAIRRLITEPALDLKVYRPVLPDSPTVEAVLLEKDGKRSIALMNWTFGPPWGGQIAPVNLRIALPDVGNFKTVRSLEQGPLKIEGQGKERSVVLPKMQDIDLLVLE